MGKVTGAYESVVRGVSQQVPHDRRSGQSWVQDNFISDPVTGLARRHGSRLLQEVPIGVVSNYPTLVSDTANHKTTRFFVDGKEYDLIYRTGASTTGRMTFAWCFNRDDNVFVPLVYGSDSVLNALVDGGVSAATNVGRYIYLAGNTVVPAVTGTDVFGATANKSKAAVWVRGGAYARTFKITVTKVDGTKLVASYKTLGSSYPNLLDTSDILTSDPDYQKKVNDRVYAYNSAVTAWIGTASEDITPANIAEKLRLALIAAGLTTGVSRIDGTITIDNALVKEIDGDDGGDGSLIRAVGNEVTAAELVSVYHYAGKIVKVRPQRSTGDDAFYLTAYAKDDGATGFTKVAWREGAGVLMQPTTVFCMATVVDGKLYIAGNPNALQALSGIDTPDFKPNAVGDGITSPLPYFVGKRITYLGVFQDRLVIGAGATIFVTRPGDYLNFFRQSVLTVIDSDPWEGFPLGAEDDTIRFSTTYDRDLLLFGERYQYVISGRSVITPKTAAIVIVSAYEDATEAAPVASFNFVFYGKFNGSDGSNRASLHQVQAGAIAQSPESFDVSQQLDDYLVGKPVEIVALAKPNMVLLRTDGPRNVLYVYSYLDNANGSERLTDSWSRWVWHPQIGVVVGVTSYKGTINVYMLRECDNQAYIACERFVRDTDTANMPYLDSLRPLASAIPSAFLQSDAGDAITAFGAGTPRFLLGSNYYNRADFVAAYPETLPYAVVGFPYDSLFTPTNPYVPDKQTGRSLLTGRLTLGQVRVAVADTGGMTIRVAAFGEDAIVTTFGGRILGQTAALIGTQPVISTTLTGAIGKEIRECKYTLASKTWLPLTITAISWAGQYFNNARQV